MDGGGGGGSGGGVGGGGSDGEEKKKVQEGGEIKVKRKMKTASQLEILEKTYAVETYPSEALRAELSVQLGLSDRQLQMWFCHRRLKDRKAPSQPAKRPRKEAAAPPAAAAVGTSGGGGDEMVPEEVGIERFSGSGSGLSPIGHLERVLPRAGTAVARIAPAEMPAMKRYYEPPQAISELRAITFVEAQLGESLREDGPILGMEFDPLPPGAFGTPIMAAAQKKSVRHYEAKLFDRPDAKSMKVASRALHEYQFLPEQPSVRSDTYERAVPSHYYGSPTDIPNNRNPSSAGHNFTHGEQVPSGYGLQGQIPSHSVLPQQGRLGHLTPSALGDYDVVPRKNAIASVGMDAHFGAHPISGLDNAFVPSDRRVSQEDEMLRMERKRKSEEARIAKEVEAHEKRIRKELEKQDIVRRKREEQMRKEMERQDRERRKEEERVLREKQREEERYQREQRREMERREKFLQKESMRAEKQRLKEEMRKEKEAARLKAANERATARRIAKESMELIDDERLELMELAASSRGLPSMLSLDGESLQSLELLRDMLPEFPPKSVGLKKPFRIQPWAESEENIGNLFMVWRFLITFADVLGLWPFTLDEFVQAFHDYDARLLGEIHVALLKSIIKDIEDVARTPTTGLGPNQNTAANPGGGHPQIVEGAYAWGFDIRCWQHHLNPLTWPEILRQFALAAGYGPKLKKRSVEPAYPRDDNEGNDGEGIISDLRNGAAAENALAIMQERGFSNRRKSRHRLTPGTVKYAAFHVLSLEGSNGLNILEVAEKIQRSGLRDLTTSKTPEASIAAALSRDTKLFERTAPSTYCVRAPYRKDPADGEAILSEALEKIQVFKNGIFDGEEAEADDAERDDAEKDEDSESDVGEDPGVDDLSIEPKLNEDALLSSESNCFVKKTFPESIISHDDIIKTSQDGFGKSSSHSTSMESGSQKELKMTSVSIDQSDNVVGIQKRVTEPSQEDTVIDESNSGEPWVQGLTEGEYTDLSVEERLRALVALVGVANEGNSIRIVLEERMEAANALKKQMWAEAQVDKRRIREEFVMKIQYPSLIGNRAEQNVSAAVLEGRESSPLAADDKNALASIQSIIQPEDLRNDLNNLNDLPTERNLVQDFPAGPDGLQLQHPGYAAEKSRSQLKAFIGHKAEEMYVYRSLPLGQDRRRNRYWQFITSGSLNDPGSGRIFVELHDGRWRLIDSEESFNCLMASLDVRGFRESTLHSMLQHIEVSVKKTMKKNFSTRITAKIEPPTEDTVRTGTLEIAARPDCSSSIDSQNSNLCISSSDSAECSSSFIIGLGRNETERDDAFKRYQDFEKWFWEECFNSSILCAMKYGETRCQPLLGICDYCHNLYFFEEYYCPSCCRSSNLNFSEQLAQFKEKLKENPYLFAHDRDSSPLRNRLLKAQLALIEASILDEALQPAWSEDFRRSWGMKLLIASSVEALLQVLTLLEGSIKRDFLSSNYETTSELLGPSKLSEYVNNGSASPQTVSVLPWLPQTTSSIGLRLMELDASIFYTLSQKEDSEKDKGTADIMTTPSKYAAVNHDTSGAVYEAGSVQDPWTDPGSAHISSGRGRGRTRGGRGRSHVGRSQRRASGQRSNTANGDGAGDLVGWKGRARGRGGRRRGRRTIKSKQKPLKKATANVGQRSEKQEDVFENSPAASLQDWNVEEETTGLQFTNVEDASSSERSDYENDNGPEFGDEYDEDIVDGVDYSNVYTRPSERFMDDADYGVDGEEDDNNDEDVDDEDDEDDEQGNVDVDGFFNGDSDENRDENRDIGGGVIGNPDDITESSSGYSD